MNEQLLRLVVCVFVGVSPLGADTITMKDHVSLNGSVQKVVNGELTIIARYSTGEKHLQVKITNTEMIEFNSSTYNPGAAPKALGIGPALHSGADTHPAPQDASDTIVLRGAQRKVCKLVGIDEAVVHCAGKDGDYNRRIVLRVLVGPQ